MNLLDKKLEILFKERTGYDHPFEIQEIKEKAMEKREISNEEKYGYKHVFQVEEVKQKCKERIKEQFGVEYICQSPIIQEKIRQSNQKNYGYDYVFQIPEIKEKIEEKCILKYGTKYPMQNAEIAAKQLYSCFGKRKEYIFPSGRKENVQGYEPLALNILLKRDNFDESDIFVDRTEVPEVWYDLNDQRKRYYTDIYIKSQNRCIEVKSDYTFEKEKELS